MIPFILRRLGISVVILFLGSVLMYVLTINSGDPLEELRQSNRENREQLMAAQTEAMGLDNPWYVRYLGWAGGAAKCLVLQCDLGDSRTGSDVNAMLVAAAGASLRLVTFATVLAIVIGVTLGILSSIRQYSGFDYVITFISFLFFSLPIFWVAVLLKDYGAIEFNNWIADPALSTAVSAVVALLFALGVMSVLGGDLRRRLLTFAVTAVVVFGAVVYFDAIGWWRQPALGIGLILLGGLLALAFFLVLTVGLANRRVLYGGLTTVGVGVLSYFVLQPVLADPSWLTIILLAVAAGVVGAAIGWFWGGYERRVSMWVSTGTALAFGFLVFVDQLLRNWAGFLDIKPRPVSTIGSGLARFDGNFWEGIFDWGVQLVLPTIALTVISLAAYSRYTRASMLETLNQDYMRTARSKGVSDRVAYTRHALRNALIPITTIVAFDFASLLGGAVITERIFGWSGLGALFQAGLNTVDPNPVMAYFLIAGTAAVFLNMLADITYAFLDPRIRR